MRHSKIAFYALLACLWIPMAGAVDSEPVVRIGLANPVLIVKDLEESTKFYTEIMGYEVVGGGPIESPVSKRTVGAIRDQNTRAVYLSSAKLEKRDLDPSGIALIHIEDTDLPQMQRGQHANDAVQGEVMLSLVVEGLEALLQRMDQGGYTILNNLQLSSSGKSNIASALDPNGIRLEMYEYLE